jgi:hypothetical protein
MARIRRRGWTAGKISDLSGLAIVVIIVLVVIACGATYRVLSPYGHGIVATFDKRPPSFLDCLYFSAITISTLGYGDFRPIGSGRVVAIAEVMFGLGAVAVGIGKFASAHESILLRLLYTSDQQRRLRDYATGLANLTQRLSAAGAKSAVTDTDLRKILLEIYHLAYTFGKYVWFHGTHAELLDVQSSSQIQSVLRAFKRLVGVNAGISKFGRYRVGLRKTIHDTLTNIAFGAESIGRFTDDPALKKASDALVILAKREQQLLQLEPIVITPELLAKVRDALPPAPWPDGTHEKVAMELGISNSLAFKVIGLLARSDRSEDAPPESSLKPTAGP